MRYKGSCNCDQWQVSICVTKPLSSVNPRICTCDYCQTNQLPLGIISDPSMVIDFMGGKSRINKNGDQLASFYYCSICDDLLAVGCKLNGKLRGAVNPDLVCKVHQLGKAIQIYPQELTASEKLDRWRNLWGALSGL